MGHGVRLSETRGREHWTTPSVTPMTSAGPSFRLPWPLLTWRPASTPLPEPHWAPTRPPPNPVPHTTPTPAPPPAPEAPHLPPCTGAPLAPTSPPLSLTPPLVTTLSAHPTTVEVVTAPHQSVRVFCCGAVAGAVSRSATAPLDRLRTVLVLQAAAHPVAGPPRTLMCHLRTIYATGGWRAFYQGNGTNLLKIAPESAVRFTVFERLRAVLHQSTDLKGTSCTTPTLQNTAEKFVAGSIAGMTAQLVVYPLEVIKTRLAAANPGYFQGIRDCGLQAVQQGGLRVLYRGLGTSLLGMVPYAGVDLCMYTTLRDTLGPTPSPLHLGACGTASSLMAQACSFPLGLVRNRLQAQGMAPDRPVLYAGMRDCLRQTYRQGGIRGLYDGLLPTALKVVPATSLSYIVYEWCKQQLDVPTSC